MRRTRTVLVALAVAAATACAAGCGRAKKPTTATPADAAPAPAASPRRDVSAAALDGIRKQIEAGQYADARETIVRLQQTPGLTAEYRRQLDSLAQDTQQRLERMATAVAEAEAKTRAEALARRKAEAGTGKIGAP